jgi:hypothetical protein
MLELLARATPSGPASIEELLIGAGTRLGRGTSVITVAAGFPDPTLAAPTASRPRVALTGIWVATGHGRPPPPGLLDEVRQISYDTDWREHDVVELL